MFRTLIAGAALAVAAVGPALADELKFANFTPPFHTINKSVIEKLNADLSAATNGALTVKGYHGGELGAQLTRRLAKLLPDPLQRIGDTKFDGGLAAISDLPKTKVYAVARWINRQRELIPWNTIEKPPSAELRPDQKDQDSLPPYEVLDQILELSVEKQLSADVIRTTRSPPPTRRSSATATSSSSSTRASAPSGRSGSPSS